MLLTSATTLAGFASLVLTEHRGLRSFAATLTLGVGACLVLSILVLPLLLAALRPLLVRGAEAVPAAAVADEPVQPALRVAQGQGGSR